MLIEMLFEQPRNLRKCYVNYGSSASGGHKQELHNIITSTWGLSKNLTSGDEHRFPLSGNFVCTTQLSLLGLYTDSKLCIPSPKQMMISSTLSITGIAKTRKDQALLLVQGIQPGCYQEGKRKCQT